MPQEQEAQTSFYEIDLSDDDDLYEALTTIESAKPVIKRLRKALTLRKERVKARAAELDDNAEFHNDGARIRVREFVLTVKEREGGGIEIPEWRLPVVAKQERA